MENNAFIRSNPSGGRASSGSSGQVVRAEPVTAPRTLLTGTLRTAAAPSERVTATPVTSTRTTQTQNLADTFAQAEAQRVAAAPASNAQTDSAQNRSLADAFAQAEARRVASLALHNGSEKGSEEVPNQDELDAALLRGTGWGKDAGGTLTLTSAASMLLDWGEDNTAARLELEPLTDYIRAWLETLDCCLQEHFRENWPNISAFGDRMVVDVTPHTGRLYDAGSPNRRTNYSPVQWAAVKEAVEQAVNGVTT